MIENSNYCGLNSLPIYSLEKIYNYLSLEDQSFTIPQVSKIWLTMSEKHNNYPFPKLAKKILEKNFSHTNQPYNEEQANHIIELAKQNHLIKILKLNDYPCNRQRDSHSSNCELIYQNKELKDLSLKIPMVNNAQWMKSFEIFWNFKDPNHLNIDKGKWRDFKIPCSMTVNNQFFYEKRFSLENFTLSFFSDLENSKKKGIFSWKAARDKEIESLKVNCLIDKALDLNLKMYVDYCVNLNTIALSQINREDFSENHSFLLFSCNKEGYISPFKELDEKDSMTFKLTLKKIEEKGQVIPILTWQISEPEENNCKMTSFMRKAILSLTTEKLAEKMGIITKFEFNS